MMPSAIIFASVLRFRASATAAAAGCCALLILVTLPASAERIQVSIGTGGGPNVTATQGLNVKGSGITIGGTFLMNSNPMSVWSVSDANSKPVGNPRVATATEATFLNGIWPLARTAAMDQAAYDAAILARPINLDKIDAARKAVIASIGKLGDFGQTVAANAGGAGNFSFVKKVQGTILGADTRLQSNTAIEEARANPSQVQTAVNGVVFQPLGIANVQATKAVPKPFAQSANIFKDPEVIQWELVSTMYYPLQVSLAGLSLSTQSEGGGLGWAFDQTSGRYINNDTNLNDPETLTAALYAVSVSQLSVDGQNPTDSIFVSTNGTAMYQGSPVTDDGLATLLMSDLVPDPTTSSTMTFNSSAVFTLQIPLSTNGETLLFPGEMDLGLAEVVPEPSTWSIMLLGLGGLGLARYRACRKSGKMAAAAA